MSITSMLLHDLVSNTVIADGEKASPDHCYTFHSYRQERVTSPSNYRKTFNVIEAALRTVRDLWVGIQPPVSFDPARARYRD
jgi:hypothetical protein